ncbi:hypothetical protein AZI85_14350 [Bdellovibrio bacteriovorus]|uniref:Uncharacterized protein n=1 Tax=Bdellovibrio bacteriovorus TaxID=959 RepID=A0A150WUX7_BDEBC|nr:hypothetical protein AZI85_14350 [Bdellovibrio bacteriovorus]
MPIEITQEDYFEFHLDHFIPKLYGPVGKPSLTEVSALEAVEIPTPSPSKPFKFPKRLLFFGNVIAFYFYKTHGPKEKGGPMKKQILSYALLAAVALMAGPVLADTDD